jgi:Ca2+-binding RTX toxin-like protein
LIRGGDGNDSLSGGAGDDTLEGEAGTGDQVTLRGAFSQYEIAHNRLTTQFTLRDSEPTRDGTDLIVGVERFAFSNLTVSADELISLVNAAPIASHAAVRLAEDTMTVGQLPVAVDAEDDSFAYSKSSNPSSGSLTIFSSGAFFLQPCYRLQRHRQLHIHCDRQPWRRQHLYRKPHRRPG